MTPARLMFPARRVAASDDAVSSSDSWGAFGARANVLRSCGRIIVRYWREHCYCPEQEGWECLVEFGLVGAWQAYEWRERVWKEGDEPWNGDLQDLPFDPAMAAGREGDGAGPD